MQLPIKAVIFDMDGVISDTEPLWQTAEKEIFGALGIDLTEEMLHSTMGLRCDEVVAKWYAIQPWENKSLQAVHDDIVARVIELVLKDAVIFEGVKDVIAQVKSAGLKLALASSSPLVLILAMLTHFDILQEFEYVHSAEFESYGKPHPAVYIHTASELGVPPVNCLAIEDSFNGLLAAKSAKMTCVLVPDARNRNDARWAIADRVLNSLKDFDLAEWA